MTEIQDPKKFFAKLAEDLRKKAEDAAKTAKGKYPWQWGPAPITKGTR